MRVNKYTGRMKKLLYEGSFYKMYSDLMYWRIDPFIRELESKKQKGRIFPFARGLRFSAHLIYAIRKILSGTELTANWGQLLDKTGTYCSCESDVIIHKEGHIEQWNGHGESIMDFRFIEEEKAVVVISCKSYLRTSDIDRDYCGLMKPFVRKIWLFSECCGPQSVENIQKKALAFGYEKFWHLYTWSKQKDCDPNKDGWNSFVEEVKKLKE